MPFTQQLPLELPPKSRELPPKSRELPSAALLAWLYSSGMRLEPEEIEALADALAPRVAAILEARLSESPAWAMSVAEAAAWARVPEDSVRHAIKTGALPVIHIGRNVRIRRCDLFKVHANGQPGAEATEEERKA